MQGSSRSFRVLYGKEYFRQCRPGRSTLQAQEIERCKSSIQDWQADPYRQGFNFERLGRGDGQNHWSIRVSQELRAILAVELEGNRPKRAAAMNIGHHDLVYRWSQRQGYRSDLDDPSQVLQPDNPALLRTGSENSAVSPLDFEEWMLFLSPAQTRLVNRHHAGAARIRGAAGTGKTVIALHRAAVLGRRYPARRILVTTFSRSLCVHMQSLFARLPDPPGNVDFINIDALAARIVGNCCQVEQKKVEQAFRTAVRAVVPAALVKRMGEGYLREEVRRVIKGRAASKEEYLDTGRFERLGRVQSFKRREREICWRLREAWDAEMHSLGTVSFEDRLIEARERVWRQPRPAYRAAIIDEGQDMTLVGVQLVRGLVGGAPDARLEPDSILFLDDSAQRIYSGGFKPAWAKLDFSAYSENITVNYRNSRSIFEAARAVRGDVVVAQEGDDDGAVTRIQFERDDAARPVLLPSTPDERRTVAATLADLIGKHGIRCEEIAILAWHNQDAEEFVRFLEDRRLPCRNLKELRGGSLANGVRVGTFDRAKGLEFRVVFIVRVGKSRFPFNDSDPEACRPVVPGRTTEPESALGRELRQLRLDRLYVAMTRARDRLYIVSDEEPCTEIADALSRFEVGRFGGGC